MLAGRLIVVENFHFDALMLVFVAGMVGFAFSGDLFNMFVFLELMSVSGAVLVGYEIGRRAPLEGSLRFALTTTVGSILLVFGIGLVYGQSGALNLAQIGRALDGGPSDMLVVMAFVLITAGLLVKATVVPFHLWTADAYAVAPTPFCILLAGAFSELGLYGQFRICWTAFHGVLGGDDEEALRAVLVGAGNGPRRGAALGPARLHDRLNAELLVEALTAVGRRSSRVPRRAVSQRTTLSRLSAA